LDVLARATAIYDYYWEIRLGNSGALQNEPAEKWVVIDNLHLVILTKEWIIMAGNGFFQGDIMFFYGFFMIDGDRL